MLNCVFANRSVRERFFLLILVLIGTTPAVFAADPVRVTTGDGTQVFCYAIPTIEKHPDGSLKRCNLFTRAYLPLGKNPTLESWWFPASRQIDLYANGAVYAGYLEADSTFNVKPATSPNPGARSLKFIHGTQLVFTPTGYAYWGTIFSNVIDLYTARRELIQGLLSGSVLALSSSGSGYVEHGVLYKDTTLSTASAVNGQVACLAAKGSPPQGQPVALYPSGFLASCTLKVPRSLTGPNGVRWSCQGGFPVAFDTAGLVTSCTH